MTAFRAFLATILVVITVYTGIVVSNHGLGLLPVFFGGAFILSAYILIVSYGVKGDVRALLLGEARTTAR